MELTLNDLTNTDLELERLSSVAWGVELFAISQSA